MVERGMRIRELEEETGIPRSTIHFYIREGLLHPPRKTGKTMGYYDRSHVERLREIKEKKFEFVAATGRTRMPLGLLKEHIGEEDHVERKRPGHASRVRSEELKARRRKEIMEAALRLYAERGYYHTSVRDIAREAGISPAAFYLYFPDKRELFVEIIEDVIGSIERTTGEVVDRTEDPFSKAVILFYAFHQSYAKVGEILNQLRAGVANNDSWAKEKLKRIYDELTARTASLVRHYIEQGLLREVDPELLAYVFTVLAEASYQRAAVDDRYTLAQLGLFTFEWLMNGVAAR